MQVESYSITGMSHAVAIDTANGCGTADTYAVNEKICAVDYVAKFFGIEGGSSSGGTSSSGSSSGGKSGSGSGSGSSSGSKSGSSSGGVSVGGSGSVGGSSSGGSSGASGNGSSGGDGAQESPFGDGSHSGCGIAPGERSAPGLGLFGLGFGAAIVACRRARWTRLRARVG